MIRRTVAVVSSLCRKFSKAFEVRLKSDQSLLTYPFLVSSLLRYIDRSNFLFRKTCTAAQYKGFVLQKKLFFFLVVFVVNGPY